MSADLIGGFFAGMVVMGLVLWVRGWARAQTNGKKPEGAKE